jgi:glycerophosphoryl diester phosphodiesterase
MKRLSPLAVVAFVLMVSSGAHAFDLQGHRGARGLAPENTLTAFATALSIGVTTLELDVGLTKDGVLVVHHDPRLNPDTARGPDGAFLQGRGPALRSLTLAEVKRYDVGRLKPGTRYAEIFLQQLAVDGERIPTLTELFDLVQKRGAHQVRFNIETKFAPDTEADTADAETFAQALAQAIHDAGLGGRATVQSFDWRTLQVMRRIAPEIVRVCLSAQGMTFDTIQRGKPGPSPWTAGLDVDDFGGSTPRLVATAACQVWSPSARDVTPEWMAEAKALGLKVIPWTVNTPTDMERLMALGVDGIITDYPDRLRAVLGAKGLPLPPAVP